MNLKIERQSMLLSINKIKIKNRGSGNTLKYRQNQFNAPLILSDIFHSRALTQSFSNWKENDCDSNRLRSLKFHPFNIALNRWTGQAYSITMLRQLCLPNDS